MTPRHPLLGRWLGWRLRLLVLLALAACLAIFALMRWLVETPHLALPPEVDTRGLHTIAFEGQMPMTIDAVAGTLPPRWLSGETDRARSHALERAAGLAPDGSTAQVRREGTELALKVTVRGFAGLGWAFWPLATLALVLLLVGGVIALARPQTANLLYLAIAALQSFNLLLVAAWLAPGWGLPRTIADTDLPLRASLDLLAAAAVLHALTLHPRPRPSALPLAPAGWALALGVACALWINLPARPWWWTQGALLLIGLAAWWAVRQAARAGPNPLARLIERFVILGLAALLAVTIATSLADATRPWTLAAARAAILGWHLLAAGLLLAPFLVRSRQSLREFTLLASISTVAAALDLLFVTLLSLSPFASLTLVVFIALGAYAWARQWLFDRLLASHAMTPERIFDQLYRAAREVQARPAQHSAQLAALLRELFEPLEVARSARHSSRSRVAGGGSTLLVPVLPLPDASVPPSTLVLRFARRGRRIFTREDALLADRVVEQLRRAVEYDIAVERGRAEERTRIAQDLHDDIGARLLTLMYQAPNAEVEDYVRHTLKDLKTLTRGLAAGEHRWSHALAEWKSDLAQRLAAARIELDWQARFDEDVTLGVVQWSAITRVLRELVSNTIHHGHAAHLRVQLDLQQRRLTLLVQDDGIGGDPQAWAHGLGLGGVRKRVKLLGGEVHWRRVEPQGIACEVQVPELAAKG